ncbi:hypothetical protein C8J48_0993 [Desmospora activa DSM 45169]|uniref:Uncharacterized protein n=1 Tax=Desmospora activa DSM 45169 TaxID=1121389 RepID=A0A2T4Z957_9BACL|nr:hypothetical protein C8J48_0993 [Desmospora activa DSM 45169]
MRVRFMRIFSVAPFGRDLGVSAVSGRGEETYTKSTGLDSLTDVQAGGERREKDEILTSNLGHHASAQRRLCS